MAKVNDWFAARLFQPDFTLVDFYAHNITPDNSTMKSADEYKNLPEVQEVFKDKSGRFDEKKFNDFYNTSLALYNQYDNDEVEKRLVEAYVHDPYEWYTPGNQIFREVGASIVLGKNPLGESQGIKGILYNGPSQYSVREIAQREKVHDENGNELDWSPNDKGGLFKGLFRPTLVLAQYDEDGTHEVDGKIVSHKKGDLKYNEDGRPYYELLGDREMYGKDLLHYTDTLTIDGKGLNAIDVFDNDGLTKSIGGTLMKTALTMGPLLIPGVGPVYGAIRASIATAQILPILGKTLDSIISGDKETEIDSTLNRLESWTSRFNSSVSDAGRQKMFSVENLGSMINAIGGQLFEQRVVGAIPRLLNKYGNITANTRAGQNLAQAYMAATSARETYQAFKEAGANDRTAGIAMAANIFALWKLMNIDYFRKSIFRGSYLDDSVVKTPSLNVAKMYRDELTGIVKEGTEQATKQTVQQAATQTAQQAAEDGTQAGSKKLFKSLTEKFSKSLKDGIKNTVKSSEFRQRSIAEGVEEVLEENISDLSKVFTLGLEALGINTGDQDLDFGYSWNEILSRYAMTFGGGVIGGAIFQGFGKWEKFLHPESAAAAWDNLGDLEKMTYFIANGRKNEIQSYYDKWHQQGRLGSTNLSADKGSTLKLPGKEGEWTANVDSKYTQNDAVYRAVTNHLNYLENLINEEGLTDFSKKLPKLLQINTDKLDDPFVRASIVNQIATQGGMLRDFSRLGAKLVKTRAELQRLTESIRSSAQNDSKEAQAEVQEKLNNNLQIKKLQDQLLKLRTERDAILNGERNDYYVERGLFRLDGATSSLFGNISKESFAQTYHGINYSSLNDDQKAQIDEEYNDFMAEKGQYLWDIAFNAYDKLSERYAPQINQLDQILQNKKRNTQYSKELYSKKRDDLVKERNKIVDEINKLNSKPESERTNEEQQKLLDLETEATKLKTQIEKYDQNPGLFLEFLGAPNSEIEKLQRILDDQSGDIALVADTIKNIYNEYKKSQTLLFNDAELDRFYDWVREDYKKRGLILDQLSKYGQEWKEAHPLYGVSEDWEDMIAPEISKTGTVDRDIFRYEGISDIQKEFAAKFDGFINLFGKDNKRALEIYEELNNFLKEQTNLEEADIKALMDHLTPVVGTQSIVDFMKEMDDIRKDILYSPFSDLFNQLTVELTGEKMPILDLVKSEELRLGSVQSLQDYTIENPLAVQQLENAQQLLDIFTGMVSGAYDGLNATANKYRKQLQKPTLGILSDHSAKLIGDEILALKNRITTLLQIGKDNGQNKLTIQKKIAANMRPKFAKTLLNPLYSDVIKEATGIDLAQEFEDNVKPDSWDWNDINESNYTDKEETFIKFESLVYDKLYNLTEDQLDTLYDKLLTIDTAKMVSSKLTDNKDEKLSSYDLAVYLTTLMSLDSNDYYAKLKSIIESPDFNVAPLYGQEFDVRTSVAAALHPARFNKLLDKLKSIKDLPDVIKNKTPLYNTSFIFGGAGVGKTVVMARLISKMVDDPAAEIVLLAPSQKQVDKLQKETGLDKATARTFDEVFKEITDNPNGIEARNIYYPKGLRYARPKDINIKDLDPLFTEGAKHKYIIIDEVAVANSVQLDLLSQYAQKVGARIIGLGDPKQTSAKITYQATVDGTTQTITDYSGLEDTLYIKSPFLTASLRPSNVAKLDNYYILDTKLSSVLDEYQNHPEWTSADISNATTLALSSGITLKYYDGNNRLVGDKMVKDSDALIVDINKVLGFKDGTIAIYTDNPSKYATFADKKNVEILPADNINGGEYDYAFVDIDWKKRATVGGDLNNFTLLQDLYTVSQRSKMATVFVNNGLIKDGSGTHYLNINVENSANAGAPLNMSKTSFDTFKTWRLQGLKNIKPSSHFDQSFAADDAHRQVANNANSGNTPPLNNTPTGNNPSNNTPSPGNPPAPKVKLTITPQEWTDSKRQEFIDNTIRNVENKHSDTELSDPNFWAKHLSKEYEDKMRIKFNSNYDGITWETEGKSAWEEARMNLMLTHSPESVALFYKNDIVSKFIESLENNPSIDLSDPNTWYGIESIVEANFPLSAEVYKHLKTDIAKALGAVQAKYMPVNPQLSLDEAKNVWDSILQPIVDNYAKSLPIESFTTHSYDYLVQTLKDSLWKKLDEYPELSKEAQKYIENKINKINRPLKAEFDQVILEDAWATNVDVFTNQITAYDPNQVRNVFEKINNYLNAFKYIDDKFKNDYRNRLQSIVNNKYESLKPTKSAEEQVAELKDQVKDKWLEWLQSDSKYQDGKYWKEHESEIIKQAADIYASFFNGPKAWKNSGRFLWNDFAELYKRDHISSVPETNTPKTHKTPKDYSFSTNDNDYYDFLFSENFINFEVRNPNSLLKLFNQKITADRYKDLVWLLGSIVKYNEDVKNYHQAIRDLFRGSSPKEQEEINKLVTILKDNNTNTYMEVMPYNDKGLLSLVIESPTNKYTVPISFVDTQGKFGRYTGQLTQVQKLSFSKSGNWISLSELQQKYPALHVGKDWAIVGRPDIENDPNYTDRTKTLVAVNKGKVMVMVTSNKLDTDQKLRSFWREGIGEDIQRDAEGNEVKFNWSYSHHEQIPLIGIHKRDKLSNVIPFAFAMQAKMSKLRKEFTPEFLATLGLVYDSNGVLKDNSVFKLLGDPTAFENIVEPAQQGEYALWRRRNIDDYSVQIIPSDRLGELVKSILISDFKDVTLRKELNSNISDFVKQKPDKKNNKNGLLLISPTLDALIQFNTDSNVYEVFAFDTKTYTIGNKIQEFRPQGTNIFNDLRSSGIDFSEAKVYFTHTYVVNNTLRLSTHTANQTITDIFKGVSNINNIDELLKDEEAFKYGVFVNDRAGDWYSGSKFYRQFRGNKEGYITDADTWTFPIYQLDESKIIVETVSQPNSDPVEEVDDFSERINTLKQTLTDLKYPYNLDTLLNPNTWTQEVWNNVINEVNEMFKVQNTSQTYPIIGQDGKLERYGRSVFNSFMNAMFEEILGDVNPTHVIPLTNIKASKDVPFAIFAITDKVNEDGMQTEELNINNTEYWVYKYDGNRATVQRTYTYQTWNELYQFIKDTNLDNTAKTTLLNYIGQLYNDNIDANIENAVATMVIDPKIFNEFKERLVKHLQDRLNKYLKNYEC